MLGSLPGLGQEPGRLLLLLLYSGCSTGHWVWLCSSTVDSDKPIGKDVTGDLSFYLATVKLN